MLYRVTGKYRGTVWRDKFCECCGTLIDEAKHEKDYPINCVIDRPCAELAIEAAIDKSGIDDIDAGEWLVPMTATLLPTDQVMRHIGAPTLPLKLTDES